MQEPHDLCNRHTDVLSYISRRGRATTTTSHGCEPPTRRKDMKIGVAVLATWLVILTCAAAQPGCPSTFFSTLLQLLPCRAAVAPFSPAPPTEACCSAVRVLGQPCLCVLVNGPAISGVDRYVAMQLPSKCSVPFQPCNVGV